MKNWKKNTVIATVLVLVCAGIYLNWLYADPAAMDLTQTLNEEQVLGETTLVMADGALDAEEEMGDYFAAMRLSRQEARDSAVTTMQETIAYAGEDEDVSTTSQALEALMAVSLQEAQIESLVIAKGYVDCVAYMADDVVSVAVPAPAEGLQETEVAMLADVVTSQAGCALSDVRIIEVK